jgi:alcohol dehydrogenase
VYYAGDITRPGCNSEYHCVDERIAGAKPKSLSFSQAAALPLTAITAWEGLFDRLHISPLGSHRGQRLLIVNGAGGVGSIAIQLARQLAQLEVISTASRPESVAWCRDLGAHQVIDHRKDFLDQLKALGIPGVDNALCCADLDQHFPAMGAALLPQGGICGIVENKQPLDFRPLRTKSPRYAIEYMFTRAMYQTPDMIEQHRLLNRVGELIDNGVLRTTVGQVLGRIDAANLRKAHALLESGKAIGKLVLEGF